jgi:hypothetical protein
MLRLTLEISDHPQRLPQRRSWPRPVRFLHCRSTLSATRNKGIGHSHIPPYTGSCEFETLRVASLNRISSRYHAQISVCWLFNSSKPVTDVALLSARSLQRRVLYIFQSPISFTLHYPAQITSPPSQVLVFSIASKDFFSEYNPLFLHHGRPDSPSFLGQ